MATLPVNITSLPLPPTASDTATFDSRADSFLAALPTMVSQLNSANTTTYANALELATGVSAASSSATAASSSATAAAGSAAAAGSSASNLANLEKLYLGGKTSDPTTDNTGGVLQTGATYYNTVSGKIKAYTGSVWADGITSTSGVSTVNGSTGAVTVQPTLVSGTTIKTINSSSVLGSGDLAVQPTLVSGTTIKSINSSSILSSGNLVVVVPDTATPFTAQQYFQETTLTDGATINWDCSVNQVAKVTLAGNRTMAAPTNHIAGAFYSLAIIQDSTGSRTLAWNTAYKFIGASAPILSTTASSKDYFTFRSDGTNLYEQGRAQGVA